MDLIQFQNNILNIDPWELLRPILEKHFDEIEQLNRDQLSRGERADGSAMPDYQNIEYAGFKEQYIDTYNIFPTTDLRYSGDFYKALKAGFGTYGISLESFDSKASELEAKYGSSIYGLTEESRVILINSINVEFKQALHNAMFLN
ncbi:hypothetical protein [Sunxiuqinia indica]|uniref:hypothetical protein n=1 Tax=Sunxiuqinia indica TaxID=2692584 RepID=UPI0013569E3A|nr:hypothetical protein [Sunxiuqinia indica]